MKRRGSTSRQETNPRYEDSESGDEFVSDEYHESLELRNTPISLGTQSNIANILLTRHYNLQNHQPHPAAAAADEHQPQDAQSLRQHQIAMASVDIVNSQINSLNETTSMLYGNQFLHQGGQVESAASMIQRNQVIIDMLSGRQTGIGAMLGSGGLSTGYASIAGEGNNMSSVPMIQHQQLFGHAYATVPYDSMLESAPGIMTSHLSIAEQQNQLLQQLLYSSFPLVGNIMPQTMPASVMRQSSNMPYVPLSASTSLNTRAHSDDYADQRVSTSATILTTDASTIPRASSSMLGDAVKAKPSLKRKPKDKPKRPLSAYNIFFKEERQRILSAIPDSKRKAKKRRTNVEGDEVGKDEEDEEIIARNSDEVDVTTLLTASSLRNTRKRNPHGKIGFENLAREIGKRWKELDDERMEYYKKHANADTKRYKDEMELFSRKQREVSERKIKLLREETGFGQIRSPDSRSGLP